MSSHIVIDGNAFYEVDDACMREKEKEREKLQKSRKIEGREEKREKKEEHEKGG